MHNWLRGHGRPWTDGMTTVHLDSSPLKL